MRTINRTTKINDEDEMLFQQTFELAPVGIFHTSENGTFIRVNRKFCELTGYSSEELLGLSFEKITHKENLEKDVHNFKRMLVGEVSTYSTEKRYIKKDGSFFWANLSVTLARNPIKYFIAIVIDITKTKQIEEEKNKQARILEKIFDMSHFAVVYLDRDFNFIKVNQGYSLMTGHEPNFFIGKNHFELYPHKENESIFRSVVETAKPFTIYAKPFEFPDHPEWGITYWDWTLHPVKDKTGEVEALIFILLDVTKPKRTELDLLKSQEKLEDSIQQIKELNQTLESKVKERTQKLKRQAIELNEARINAENANRAKSIFLSNMSHELRTPLNHILGHSQLMQRDSNLSENNKKDIEAINRSGKHLLGLINDVLEISKIEANKINLESTVFDLHQLLYDLEMMFQVRTQEKELSFELKIHPNVPRIIVSDEGKLRQVLINFLSNAVKFTKKGGIIIRVYVKESILPDLYLTFEIEDSGIGIADDEIKTLFQPFVQVAKRPFKQFEGTGLGLAICQKYINLMGGGITVSSLIGKGSKFIFEIKFKEEKSEKIQKKNRNDSKVIGIASGQKIPRIIVVDDLEDSRLLLACLLEIVGFEVRQASNGLETINIWETWRDAKGRPAEIIFMDMRMPVMDGIEATRYIKEKEEKKNTHIIAVSASAFKEDEKKFLKYGCDEFIKKPYEEVDIFDAISQYTGIQYLYKTEKENTPKQISKELGPEDFSELSLEYLNNLQETLYSLDPERISTLLKEIELEHNPLYQKLAILSEELKFDKILSVLKIYLEATQEEKKV